LTVSLLLLLLSRNGLFKTFLGNQLVFIDVMLIFVIMFSLAFFLSYLLVLVQARLKTTSLVLSVKTITNKSAYKYYISVMLVSILCIFLIFSANYHIQRKSEILKEEQKVDFILLNMLDRYQIIFDQVRDLENVDEAQLIIYYQNIDLFDQELTIDALLGLNANDISLFFGYDINDSFIEALNDNEKLVMILPYRFQDLHGYELGEQIELNINEQILSFEIIGFFDKEIGSKAFTNLHLFLEQYSLVPNAILVNANHQKDELYNTLITMFSQYLVFTIDFQHELDEQISIIENANNYLIYVNLLMILFFLIAVIIHTMLLFDQMKEIYAKFIMLGISQKQMLLLLFKENIYIFVIVFVSSLFGFLNFYEQIPKLVLAFSEFEKIHFSMRTFSHSIIVSLAFVSLTKILYIVNAMKYNTIKTLKYYE
jgi:putative ABC transport system permease protein